MSQEVETKVLDIDKEEIKKKLLDLGAKKTQETRFLVDWFWTKGTKEGKEPWFLRIRTNSDGKNEVTWKAKSDISNGVRRHKEINFLIGEPKKLADLFFELDLEKYAHQEKNRTSFIYKDWQFDLDEYPNMPPFLEIEGKSEEHVREAIKMLGLENNKTWADGERKLIKDVYDLDWFLMRF